MKKLWATLLVVVMIMGFAVNSFAYYDNNYTGHRPYASSNEKTVPSWLEETVDEYGAEIYVDPNRPVTRLDVFFSIARMLENKFKRDGIMFSTLSYAPFSDMGHLESSCVPLAAGLYNRGILRGYDDGTARLPQNITRAEFTAVVNRLAHLTGKIGYGYSYYGMYPQFADVKGHWAESVICETAAAGMMSGVGNNMFHPEGLVTYAQLFKVLTTFVDDNFGLQEYDVAYGCTNTWDVDFDIEEDAEEDAGTKITSLTATESTIRIAVGEEVKTKVKINPSDATNKTLSWEAQSERTVFVNDYYTSGNYGYVVIEGNKVGTTYIVGSATDGSKKTVKIKVVVTDEEDYEEDETVYVTSINVNPSEVEMKIGESQTITATVKPTNASNKGIRWESHNEAVATVSGSGKITAVGVGNTVVTATAKDGSGIIATIDVTVVAPEEEVPNDTVSPVVELMGADNVAVGQKVTLTAKVDEENLQNFSITEADLLGLTGGASINKIKKVSDDTYEITLMGVEVSSLALCIDAGVATDVAGNASKESNEVIIFINSGEDI